MSSCTDNPTRSNMSRYYTKLRARILFQIVNQKRNYIFFISIYKKGTTVNNPTHYHSLTNMEKIYSSELQKLEQECLQALYGDSSIREELILSPGKTSISKCHNDSR